MNTKLNFTLVLTVAILLTNCSNKKEETTFNTIDYYNAHPKKRDARRKECVTMKVMTRNIQIDCNNANSSYIKKQSAEYDAGANL